jgi:hypothetical protein
MSGFNIKAADPGQYPPPREDEESLALQRDWSPEEEVKAKRKCVTPGLLVFWLSLLMKPFSVGWT